MPLRSVQLGEDELRALDAAHRARLAEVANKTCLTLLKQVMNHTWAWPFNHPVDTTKYTDYLTVIGGQPMDFSSMRLRCESGGGYKDAKEFWADMMLVFANARKYNPPGSDVYVMANTLQEETQKLYHRIVEPKLAEVVALRSTAEAALRRQKLELANATVAQLLEQQACRMVSYLEDLQAALHEARLLAAAAAEPLSMQEKGQLAAELQALPAAVLEAATALVATYHPATAAALQSSGSAGGVSVSPSASGRHQVDLNLNKYDALLLRQLQHLVQTCGAQHEEGRPAAGADGEAGAVAAGALPQSISKHAGVTWPNIAVGAGKRARAQAQLLSRELVQPSEAGGGGGFAQPLLLPPLGKGALKRKLPPPLALEAAAGDPFISPAPPSSMRPPSMKPPLPPRRSVSVSESAGMAAAAASGGGCGGTRASSGGRGGVTRSSPAPGDSGRSGTPSASRPPISIVASTVRLVPPIPPAAPVPTVVTAGVHEAYVVTTDSFVTSRSPSPAPPAGRTPSATPAPPSQVSPSPQVSAQGAAVGSAGQGGGAAPASATPAAPGAGSVPAAEPKDGDKGRSATSEPPPAPQAAFAAGASSSELPAVASAAAAAAAAKPDVDVSVIQAIAAAAGEAAAAPTAASATAAALEQQLQTAQQLQQLLTQAALPALAAVPEADMAAALLANPSLLLGDILALPSAAAQPQQQPAAVSAPPQPGKRARTSDGSSADAATGGGGQRK